MITDVISIRKSKKVDILKRSDGWWLTPELLRYYSTTMLGLVSPNPFISIPIIVLSYSCFIFNRLVDLLIAYLILWNLVCFFNEKGQFGSIEMHCNTLESIWQLISGLTDFNLFSLNRYWFKIIQLLILLCHLQLINFEDFEVTNWLE